MNLLEAIGNLKSDIEKLANAHAVMQSTMEKLGGQLEIARNNIEVLQNIYLKANSIPLNPNHPAGRNQR